MSRVAWSFDGFDWLINPDQDSGWIYEHALSEEVPIQATASTVQFGGRKSPRRQIHGWIWGVSGSTQFAKLDGWRQNRTQSTLTDHLGASRNAILIKFEPKLVNDFQEWGQGRQTYEYTAEFIGT